MSKKQKKDKDINQSGMQPVEYKVLVFPDKIEEKTKGGIILPDEAREKEEWAQVKATLVAIGGNAFENWSPPLPSPGQRVYVAKYAGFRVRGADGEMYQLVNDKDVAAIIFEE